MIWDSSSTFVLNSPLRAQTAGQIPAKAGIVRLHLQIKPNSPRLGFVVVNFKI
jgi:hypothetical protein